MKELIVLFNLCLFSGVMTLASDSLEDRFAEANEKYASQEYDSALMIYQAIEDTAFHSAELYYNMGNAYFKLNDIPHAILYYERAMKLKPHDEDLLFNLELAKSYTIDKIEEVPGLFLKQWWNTFYHWFSADEWAWISVVVFLIMLSGVYLVFTSRKILFKRFGLMLTILMLFISVMSFGLASQKYYYQKEQKEAIIFTPTLTAKSAPNQNGINLFVVHEGTKVSIVDHVMGWNKVKLSDGNVGWLPAESMKGI